MHSRKSMYVCKHTYVNIHICKHACVCYQRLNQKPPMCKTRALPLNHAPGLKFNISPQSFLLILFHLIILFIEVPRLIIQLIMLFLHTSLQHPRLTRGTASPTTTSVPRAHPTLPSNVSSVLWTKSPVQWFPLIFIS